MHQLLEHGAQWGPIAGLVICFSIFLFVLLYQIFDRRPHFQEHMSQLPLDSDNEQGE